MMEDVTVVENNTCCKNGSISEPRHRRMKKKKKQDVVQDETLRTLLDACDFFISVRKEVSTGVGRVLDIGFVKLDIIGECMDLSTLEEFWLYISSIPHHSFLYVEVDGLVKYNISTTILNLELYSGLTNKCFGLQFWEKNGNEVCLKVVIYELLCISAVPFKEAKSRNIVLSHIFNIDLSVPEDVSNTDDVDLGLLYSSLRKSQNGALSGPIEHPYLIPKLRPYQESAVSWMLQKETTSSELDMNSLFCVELVAKNNQIFYYNKFEGYIMFEKPLPKLLPKGGILADEMGLGKTVEVLALIVMNPRGNNVANSVDNCARNFEPRCESQIKSDESRLDKSEVENSNDSSDSTRESLGNTKIHEVTLKRKRANINKSDGTSTKVKPKGTTYKLMHQWYNRMLLETSYKKRSFLSVKSNEDPKPGLKCVCGEQKKRIPRIQCNSCLNWQHLKCMGSPEQKGYLCPRCWLKQEPVDSGTTLIVSPASISNQWLAETQKYIRGDDFRVLFYRGVQKDGFLQPHFIASHQLVLTTYEILRKELVHADVNICDEPRSLRYSKRFCPVSSPLVLINWWRVCLDEAQMVEHSCSKTAEMACRLRSVHRWAVSGTPVQKTVQDLFGLLQFLGVEPYNALTYWTRCLYIPYCGGNLQPLHELLNNIMWRTMKNDVLHEINIPEQTHEFHWLHFTPVEEHFYRLQHTTCSNDFVLMCSKFGELDIPLKSVNRNILHKLMAPLLRLRQACSHHRVVRGFNVSQKATTTMEELLESLLRKTKLEAEEALRRTNAAINGLAGIHIIKELWSESVECYREVLQLSEQYKGSLKTDTLQLIHTLHNLAEILATHSDAVCPTLRDHQLQQQAKELEEKFMNKQEAQVRSAHQALTPMINHTNQLLSHFSVGRSEWWSELVMWLMTADEKGEFVLKVYHELLEHQVPGRNSIISRVKTLSSLNYQLAIWCDVLFENRQEALHKLQVLTKTDQQDLANAAVDCHLRTNNVKSTKRKRCPLCLYETVLKEYESHLFSVSSKQTEHTFVGDVMIMNQLNQGTWKPTEQERIIRALIAFGRMKHASVELIDDGNTFVKVLEGMKKEFKQLRYTWTQIRDRISVQDELHMAKLRLRVRFDDEPEPETSRKQNPLQQLSSIISNKLETIHVIESHEVESHAASFRSDRILCEMELRRKMGQLQYLKNLEKNQGCKRNTEPCPICQAELGEKWSVLQCGHCFCVECIQLLMQSNGLRMFNIKCPVCRDITHSNDISFVDIGAKYAVEDKWPDTSVIGSFSTKIDAVIRCLLTMKKSQPEAKALVFSSWEKVLDVLELALKMNNISFRRLRSGSKYKDNLRDFKEGHQHITALIIPVRLGAKGLNLTEATHVLLVDPMLNLSDELQAVGRVHRIGQTKETTVHHFFIRGTIEERIYEATHSSADKWNDNSITVQQLLGLFNCSSEGQTGSDTQPAIVND